MSGHIAQTRHLTSGWLRWQAYCPCGWTQKAKSSSEAEDAADQHHRDTTCTCTYAVGDVVEHSPDGPCAACRKEAS